MKKVTTTIRYVYMIEDDLEEELEGNKIEWAHQTWPHPAVNEQVYVVDHKIEDV